MSLCLGSAGCCSHESGLLCCLHGGRVHLSAQPFCLLRKSLYECICWAWVRVQACSCPMHEPSIPMCLSVNIVHMHVLFCKEAMTRGHFLHVFPSAWRRRGAGRQCAHAPGRESCSELGLSLQCDVRPYTDTTTPAACSSVVASRPVVFQVIALKQITASLLFSLTCVTLHWFCLKPAPPILSLTIRNPPSLLLPSCILTCSLLWVMSPCACLKQWDNVNS